MTFQVKDSDGNVLIEAEGKAEENQFWIGRTFAGAEVVEVIDSTPVSEKPTVEEIRREVRTEVFSTTLDRMNPIWYNSLTTEQQADLATWRQAWLDYPATGIEPTQTWEEVMNGSNISS